MRNCADLVIVPGADNAANQNLIGAHLSFGGLVDLHDVVLYLLRNDWRRILGPGCRQHHEEMAFCFHAEIALDGVLQLAPVGLPVGTLDGVHVGVGS